MRSVTTTNVEYVAIVEVSDAGFIVWFPDVPGAVVGVDRVQNIPERATSALHLRFAWLEQHDRAVPEARPMAEVLADPVVRLSMVDGIDFAISIPVQILIETTSTIVPKSAAAPGLERGYALH